MRSQVIYVLLVEDDVDYSALLRRRLMVSLNQDNGPTFVVAQACLLQEAIAYATTQPVDVVVLDLHLPDANGLETLMRVQQAMPGVATIVLTGRNDQQIARQALELGAHDYLVKGNFNAEVLVRAIRYALDRKESEQALREATKRLCQGKQTPTPVPMPDDLANDFDSLLTKLATQNSLALSELENDNPARVHVEKLDQTIHMVSALTRRLFAKSK